MNCPERPLYRCFLAESLEKDSAPFLLAVF